MENIINLLINGDKNIAEYNGKEINRDFSEEISKLIDIFSNFTDLDDSFVLDGESFEIEVVENNISRKFCSTNLKYYNNFKQIVEEIIKCF